MEIKPADKEIIDHKDLRYKRKVSNKGIKDMNKQAYEKLVGLALRASMSKTAAAGDELAYVGNWPIYKGDEQWKKFNPYTINSYFAQLFDNRRKSEKKNNTSNLFGQYPVGFGGSEGRPIMQKGLDINRKWQAAKGARWIFPENTRQYDAAKQYLIERGKENQKRYQDGVLWKNEPSKVPMPSVISHPLDIQRLDTQGAGMANVRIPGQTKNNIVG